MTIPSNEELITFLKQEAEVHSLESCDGEPVTTWLMAAADRLAELSEEVEELTADRDRLQGMCEEAAEKLDRVSSENAEMHTELERLNLWIIRLREAMGKYADAMNWHCTEIGEYHEHSEKCCKDGWWTLSGNGYEIARTALQENNDAN